MELIPIKTPLLQAGQDFAEILSDNATIEDGDILVLSSKAIATLEGAHISLDTIDVGAEAESWAQNQSADARFAQAVFDETLRLNGSVLKTTHGMMLTELKPEEMDGSIVVPNAGLDRSNCEDGYAIGWPGDPVESAKSIQTHLGNVAVIISDSCVHPRRRGVSAFALACAGIDPIHSQKGSEDLYEKELQYTEEAIADQLSTAANMLMGNAAQSVPAVIVRDHSISFTDFAGWVPGISPQEDLWGCIVDDN